MYTKCIVREPCAEMVEGLSTARLGKPDFGLAKEQHMAYVSALEQCGCKVSVLPADPRFPDSVFVEDTALLIGEAAVITRPGAETRRREVIDMRSVLGDHYEKFEKIGNPGTLEAGDVLEVGEHYFIGISERTNEEGAEQLLRILQKYGKSGSTIHLDHYLHLKTGVANIGNNTLLVAGELKKCRDFQKFRRIEVDDMEEYASNSILINGTVMIPSGYPKIFEKLTDSGFDVMAVDTTEFRKLDGGLSCLSLRF